MFWIRREPGDFEASDLPGSLRVLDGIAFRQAEHLGNARPASLRIAYRLGVNDYAGVRSAELVIEYLEPA